MQQLIALIDWLTGNPHWIGLAVFILAFSESLAVFGLLVPGAVGMFAFGVLIEAGVVDFGTVWLWAIAGAIAGDALSFWLGHRYGRQLMALWPLRRYPDAMNRGMRFFAAHGGKSVVIGRFVGAVRPIIPAVAGMMGMSRWRFAVANVGSAVFWAPAYLLPGMVFSASLAVAAAVATRLASLVVLTLVGSWLLWRGWLMLAPRARRWCDQLVAGLQAMPPLRPLAAALAAFEYRRGRLWWLAVVVAAAAPVLALGPRPLGWEALIMQAMIRWRTEWGRWVAWAISQIGAPPGVIAGALVLIAGLLWVGRRRLAMLFGAGVIGVVALVVALDTVVGVPASPDRFPSAHAAGAAALLLSVVWLGWPVHVRRSLLALAACGIASVALGRVYLGGALPLDAVAGVGLGVAVAGPLALVGQRPAVSRRILGLVAVVVVAGASIAAWEEGQRGLRGYPEPVVFPVLPAAASCERAHDALGAIEGYTLWQGSEGMLRDLSNGPWVAAAPWTLRGSMQWLDPTPNPIALPPVPALLDGRAPSVSLIRDSGDDERLVLHAWPAARGAEGAWQWWRIRVVVERLIAAWPLTLARSRDASLPEPLVVAGRVCGLAPEHSVEASVD